MARQLEYVTKKDFEKNIKEIHRMIKKYKKENVKQNMKMMKKPGRLKK